jgi:hypothetical protein
MSLVPCPLSPVPGPRSLMGSFDPCRTVIITSISSWPSQALFAGNITAKHSDPTAFEVAQRTGQTPDTSSGITANVSWRACEALLAVWRSPRPVLRQWMRLEWGHRVDHGDTGDTGIARHDTIRRGL